MVNMLAAMTAAIGIDRLARWVWRRFRLRMALFRLREQLSWSRQYAPRNKLVLDVGAGNNPHLRADVLCDKFVFDDLHRGGQIARDRPLVAGDASALPFKDNAFDVIISRDMIEHLPTPDAFFDSAGRVSKAGTFFAPAAISERLWSYGTHLWQISKNGTGLKFKAKKQRIVDPELHQFFESQIMVDEPARNEFAMNHWDNLSITYHWQGTPQCSVQGNPFDHAEEFDHALTGEGGTIHKPSGSERIRALIKRSVRGAFHIALSANRNVNLADILACPQCTGDVTMTTTAVRCANCQVQYPILHGIPMMLVEHAVPIH